MSGKFLNEINGDFVCVELANSRGANKDRFLSAEGNFSVRQRVAVFATFAEAVAAGNHAQDKRKGSSVTAFRYWQ